MISFFQEAINQVNLPVTLLMLCVLGYWLMMIFGVVGMDVFDVDVDTGVDLGVDADIDIGMDADLGVDGGVGEAPGTVISGSATTGNEGFLRSVFEFFYLGEIPIVIIGTFFVLFWWIVTFVTNHYFNPGVSLWAAAAWVLPNLFFALILTRFAMIPFAILFKKPPPENKTREEMMGVIGRVTTSEVTEKFGQMEYKLPNEPETILNVRTKPGEKLARNDAAKIVSYNHANGTFLVELTKWENEADE